jgi:hypothetical protein
MIAETMRTLIQNLFIRVCRDSRFSMDPIDAAVMTGSILKCHPIQVWVALDIDNMTRIANGTHPAVN